MKHFTRKHFTTFPLLATTVTVGCHIGKAPASGSASGESVLFYAADYGVGAAIYSLNLATLKVSATHAFAQYTDAKIFNSKTTNDNYFAVRNPLEDAPSTLTKLASNSSNVVGQIGSLPVNLYGALTLPSNKIFVTGWNKGEIAVVPTSLASAEVKTLVPTGLPTGAENARFVGAVAYGNNVHVISGGTSALFEPKQARIHSLSANYSQVESTVEIPNCQNISGDGFEGFVNLGSSQAIVSCNPRYNSTRNAWSGLIALAQVIVGDSGIKTRILASATSSAAFDMYNIRSQSADGNSVFIEEAASISTPPYIRTLSRYWLNVSSGEKTSVTRYGGSGMYVKSNDSYLFSCVLNEQGDCKAKTFCAFKSANFPGGPCDEIPVAFDYTFRSFPQVIPELP